MKAKELLQRLDQLDAWGIWAVTYAQLRVFWPDETDGSFRKALHLHASEGITLQPVCRGLYVNPRARSMPSNTLAALVPFIRPWADNYISMETVLGGTDDLSQLPGRLVVVSTGRSAVVQTPYGDIEFVRSRISAADFYEGLQFDEATGMWFAARERAVADYRRHQRSQDLLVA